MNPDQQNQNGGIPPQQPQYVPPQQPQQAPSGQYEVLPPLPIGQNSGHSGHNPYEFIVNPQATQKKSPLLGGNKFFAQIAVIVGGAILLIVVAAIAISAFAPKGSTAGMTAIAQRQQEIVRIATAATGQASSQDTKNFMVNVNASIASEQAQAISYLAAHNTKLKDKVLAMDQSSDTDARLANALTTNTYDTASIQIVTDQLGTYQGLIKRTYNDTNSTSLKQQLQSNFKSVSLLLEQAKNIATK